MLITKLQGSVSYINRDVTKVLYKNTASITRKTELITLRAWSKKILVYTECDARYYSDSCSQMCDIVVMTPRVIPIMAPACVAARRAIRRISVIVSYTKSKKKILIW